MAHDYTLRSQHPNGLVFALQGGVHEPVIQQFGQNVLVGLPALALRIETTLNLSLMLLADSADLVCHHPGGMAAVDERFWMATIDADSVDKDHIDNP